MTSLYGCQPVGTSYWTAHHLYEEAGQYQAKLTARDSTGAIAEYTIPVIASPPTFTEITHSFGGQTCTVYRRDSEGSCASYQPLLVKVEGTCYPLDGLALCDPNQAESPCPLIDPSNAEGPIYLDVFSDRNVNTGAQPSWSLINTSGGLSPLNGGQQVDESCIPGKILFGERYQVSEEGDYFLRANSAVSISSPHSLN